MKHNSNEQFNNNILYKFVEHQQFLNNFKSIVKSEQKKKKKETKLFYVQGMHFVKKIKFKLQQMLCGDENKIVDDL